MNISPVGMPKFGALYKTAEDERKGDQAVAVGSALVGAASMAAGPVVPPVVSLFGFGSFLEGMFRLIGFGRRSVPGPKTGVDQAKLQEGAGSAAAGTASMFVPGLQGAGGALIPMGIGKVYDGLKGKPDVKAPEL